MRRLWRLCSKPPWPLHQAVETRLALVAEGGVAKVVGEGDGFGEVLVQAEGAGDVAGDGGDFDGVRQAGAEVVAGAVEEDLGLVFEAAEGARVDDAVAVALVFGAPIGRRFGVPAAAGIGAELGIGSEELTFELFEFLSRAGHEFRLGARAGKSGGTRAVRCWISRSSLDGDAAQLEQAPDGVLDEVVRAGGAGGDADGDLARREPIAGLDFLVLVLVVMQDDVVAETILAAFLMK